MTTLTKYDNVNDGDLLKLQEEAVAANDLETVYLVNTALNLDGPQAKMPSKEAQAKLEAHIRNTRTMADIGRAQAIDDFSTSQRKRFKYSYKASRTYDSYDDAMRDASAVLALMPAGAITDTHWASEDGCLTVHPSVDDARLFLDEMARLYNGTRSGDYADLTAPGCNESYINIVDARPSATEEELAVTLRDDLRKTAE